MDIKARSGGYYLTSGKGLCLVISRTAFANLNEHICCLIDEKGVKGDKFRVSTDGKHLKGNDEYNLVKQVK